MEMQNNNRLIKTHITNTVVNVFNKLIIILPRGTITNRNYNTNKNRAYVTICITVLISYVYFKNLFKCHTLKIILIYSRNNIFELIKQKTKG